MAAAAKEEEEGKGEYYRTGIVHARVVHCGGSADADYRRRRSSRSYETLATLY